MVNTSANHVNGTAFPDEMIP